MFGQLFPRKRKATGTPMDLSPTAKIMPGDQPAPKQRGIDEKLYALGGLIANLGGVQNNAAGEYVSMQRAREEQARTAQAQQQQMQQTVAALVQQGVPEPQARVIAQGGGADALLAKRYEPQNPTSLQQNYEWLRQTDPKAADAYLERMTNNYEYRQGADGRFYRIDIAEPQVLGDTLPQGWTIQGDGSGNAAGGFRP